MLALLVFAALVGDLVVLPALLTTRLGGWFRPAAQPRCDSPQGGHPR
jgi:hypothetical protein